MEKNYSGGGDMAPRERGRREGEERKKGKEVVAFSGEGENQKMRAKTSRRFPYQVLHENDRKHGYQREGEEGNKGK